ncbi:MAG: anti-sigma factor antagonist [Frankiales bacterium]|nr:anti-sigma factor antagonist [Frankiales bacterium]
MAISVKTSPNGQVSVVVPAGDHDLATASELRRALYPLATKVPLIVLNFAETTLLDSTALGVIVGACKRAEAHGHHIIGVNAHGTMLRALQITGIGDLVQLAKSTASLDVEIEQLLVRPKL